MAKEPKKRAPLVLVSGSAQDGRTYEPPVPNPAAAREAAVRIGTALAKAGCRIAVSSADADYIEGQVVQGFIEALKANKATKKDQVGRIEIHAPLGGNTAFAGRPQHSDMFVDKTDPHPGWRRSFMRSLAGTDAVLLVGGGRMTAVIGHAAAGFGIPALALPSFGGAAQEVWQTITPGKNGPTPEEHAAMAGLDWSPNKAQQAVANLLAQIARREAESKAALEAEQQRRLALDVRAVIGVVILIVAILLTWAASQSPSAGWANLLLYLLGPIGGCAAALTASTLQEKPPHGMVHAASLGFFAGFLASALYLLAQMSAEKFEPKPLAFLFACVTGIGAGFAAEKVLREWMSGKKMPVVTKPGS
ncbi:MAG TPA: hypothetical protein VGC80_16870 [Acetobacteraceae bacterium]